MNSHILITNRNGNKICLRRESIAALAQLDCCNDTDVKISIPDFWDDDFSDDEYVTAAEGNRIVEMLTGENPGWQ